jgi:hypothetical protein
MEIVIALVGVAVWLTAVIGVLHLCGRASPRATRVRLPRPRLFPRSRHW